MFFLSSKLANLQFSAYADNYFESNKKKMSVLIMHLI